MQPNGYVIYQGPSMLTGKPIVALVTGFRIATANRKMGATPLQTWILARDVDPIEAARTGADSAGCGDCKHRGKIVDGGNVGRSCYVEYHWGVRNLWLAYRRGNYPIVSGLSPLVQLGRDHVVRLGTYGDPAAVPVTTWAALTMRSEWHLGYTHQWRTVRVRSEWQRLCMASVDTPEERSEARSMGWRTFRVRRADQELADREIACPASAEMGHRSSCEDCRACSGTGGRARVDVAIVAHGAGGRIGNFNRASIPA